MVSMPVSSTATVTPVPSNPACHASNGAVPHRYIAVAVTKSLNNGDNENPANGFYTSVLVDDYVLSDIQQWSPRVFVRFGDKTISADERLIEGDWYHLALTYDGSAMKLYLNGHETAGGAPVPSPEFKPAPEDSPIQIGDTAFGPRYRGRIDDLRIYSRALSPEEARILGVDEPVRAVLSKPAESRSKDESKRLRAFYLETAATPELASLIQDALRRRNELAPYARREIYRELATYLQSEISPFPDELVERLSDEQYLINASGILFGDQRPSRVQG